MRKSGRGRSGRRSCFGCASVVRSKRHTLWSSSRSASLESELTLSATSRPSQRARKSRLGVSAYGRFQATNLSFAWSRPGHKRVLVKGGFVECWCRPKVLSKWRQNQQHAGSCACARACLQERRREWKKCVVNQHRRVGQWQPSPHHRRRPAQRRGCQQRHDVAPATVTTFSTRPTAPWSFFRTPAMVVSPA